MLSFKRENIPLLRSGLKIHVLECLLYILDYIYKNSRQSKRYIKLFGLNEIYFGITLPKQRKKIYNYFMRYSKHEKKLNKSLPSNFNSYFNRVLDC